jgi:hypothetical protein
MLQENRSPNETLQQNIYRGELLNPLPQDVSFSPDDYILPRWKIDKRTGFFVNTVTGEEKQTLLAIIIKVDKSKFMWPKKYGESNLPDCYSVNGITPFDDNTRYGQFRNGVKSCVGCPLAEWVNGEKPRCAISYNYLLADLDTDQLAVLNLSRSRSKTARGLNSWWKFNGVKYSVSFFTEIEKTPGGDFWQVRYQICEKINEWQPYAIQMLESKTIELTGSMEIARLELTEPEELTTDINLTTGEVSEIQF